MPDFPIKNKSLLVAILSAAVSACGGGGGGGGGNPDPGTDPQAPTAITPTPLQVPTASLELIDPTPGAGDEFGSTGIVQLSNGNIVVRDQLDSSVAEHNGAVHLYSPLSATPIASLYGDNANDSLGSIVELVGDAYYVIASPFDDVNGLVDAGSVRLMNGNTGEQVAMVSGPTANALLGSGSITELGNGNFVVASPNAAQGNLSSVGSVWLVNGETGQAIGEPLTGVAENDRFGNKVFVLSNNNYVITSLNADVNGIENAGSVVLVNGETGEQMGATLNGDEANDTVGRNDAVDLGNGNYVVTSSLENNGDATRAGSVRLFNGSTGAQIGATLFGEAASHQLGSLGTYSLGNGNYVVASPSDSNNGVIGGSVRLFNGTTGAAIGTPIRGDSAGDQFGRITVLPNGNYVIRTRFDDENGVTEAGSVRLVNGTTGVQIGPALVGDNDQDMLSTLGVVALNNGNYVVASQLDDVNGVSNAGSVRLMDGDTGEEIALFTGNDPTDAIGRVLALNNNNYVVLAAGDTVNGVDDAGSIRLFNGSNGAAIGDATVGDIEDDLLGRDRGIALASSKYVVLSSDDDENGIVDAGSVRLFDGNNGRQIGDAIVGEATDDMSAAVAQQGVGGDYFILTQRRADKGGLEDSGRVRIVLP
ncbi:hypothetical protein [Bacterioplanoides sp.]|uniref:hypothetical protein n=1 Tax=Bacterioplanoides sp. TaxID=2066072 RepID=UPI003B000F3E